MQVLEAYFNYSMHGTEYKKDYDVNKIAAWERDQNIGMDVAGYSACVGGAIMLAPLPFIYLGDKLESSVLFGIGVVLGTPLAAIVSGLSSALYWGGTLVKSAVSGSSRPGLWAWAASKQVDMQQWELKLRAAAALLNVEGAQSPVVYHVESALHDKYSTRTEGWYGIGEKSAQLKKARHVF